MYNLFHIYFRISVCTYSFKTFFFKYDFKHFFAVNVAVIHVTATVLHQYLYRNTVIWDSGIWCTPLSKFLDPLLFLLTGTGLKLKPTGMWSLHVPSWLCKFARIGCQNLWTQKLAGGSWRPYVLNTLSSFYYRILKKSYFLFLIHIFAC